MRLNYWRRHRRVFMLWNDWVGIQLVLLPEISFGIRVEPRRPLVDLFLGPLTLAFGRHPILSDPRMAQRHAARGFIPADADESFWGNRKALGIAKIDWPKEHWTVGEDDPVL